MLKEDTIKKEMRRLRKIIDERRETTGPDDPVMTEAYGMECALQWALGGCDWTPHEHVFIGHKT